MLNRNMNMHRLSLATALAFITLLMLAYPTGVARAAVITSNGTGGGNWNNPATWAGGVVPTANDDVIIDNGDTVDLNIDPPDLNSLTLRTLARLNDSVATDFVIGDLVIGNSAIVTLDQATALTVNGTWTQTGQLIYGGTLTMAGVDKTYSNAFGNTIAEVVIDTGVTITQTGPGITRIENFTNNGTFTSTGGSINMNGAPGTIAGTGTTSFTTLNIQGTPTVITAQKDFTVTTAFTIGASGQFFGDTGTAMTFTGGTWTQNGPYTHNGTVNINSTVALNTGNWFTQVNDININGSLTANNGAGNLRVSGDWTNNGAFDPRNNVVVFNGTSIIGGTAPTTFYDIQVAGTPTTVTMVQDVIINNDFTIGASGSFTANAGTTLTLNNAAAWSQNGPFRSDGLVVFNGTRAIVSGTWQPQFTDVQLNGTLTAPPPPSVMRVAGDFTIDGTFNANGGLVTFNGTGAQDLTANVATNFNDLTVSGASIVNETVVADNAIVNGTLTNDGRINKVNKLVAVGANTFGLAEGNLPGGSVFLNLNSGGLTELQVSWIGQNSPNAGAAQQTGNYWLLTPSGTGYNVDLTLPHNNVTDPGVCFYTGAIYNCAVNAATTADATRTGITDLTGGLGATGEWLIGANSNADIAVTKAVALTTDADNNGEFTPGDTVTYTLTVSNNGPATASGVIINDDLPTGVTYTGDDSGGAYVPGTGEWTIGTLANAANATLNITATIDAGTEGNTITNTASVQASSPTDTDNTNDSADAAFTVVLVEADLVMNKTVAVTNDADGNNIPTPGDTITYTVTLTNNGPGDTRGVEVLDNLPTQITVVTTTPSGSTTYDPGTGLWDIGDLANSASVTLTIEATINAGTENQTVTNIATVQASDEADPTPSNNTESAVFVVGEATADLSVAKTVALTNSPDTIYDPGDEITYTVTVTNNGISDTTDVSVLDSLPAGVTYLSDDSGGAYDDATGVWTVGNLNNGASAALQIVASIDTGTEGSTITNDAALANSDAADPNPDNDNRAVSFTVKAVDNGGDNGDDDDDNGDDNDDFQPTLTPVPSPTGLPMVVATPDALAEIEELPATGETPPWRGWVLAAGAAAVTGLGWFVYSKAH